MQYTPHGLRPRRNPSGGPRHLRGPGSQRILSGPGNSRLYTETLHAILLSGCSVGFSRYVVAMPPGASSALGGPLIFSRRAHSIWWEIVGQARPAMALDGRTRVSGVR